jgi:hypothetical protein
MTPPKKITPNQIYLLRFIFLRVKLFSRVTRRFSGTTLQSGGSCLGLVLD